MTAHAWQRVQERRPSVPASTAIDVRTDDAA